MLPSLAIAPVAQHRGRDAQLAGNLDQPPTAARQQGDRLRLKLIPKVTPFPTHSTPSRSPRSLPKVSTNPGEAQIRYRALLIATGYPRDAMGASGEDRAPSSLEAN